jgi:hypothetical protein
MRRYYFDLRDGGKLQTDDEGRELSSFEDVQEEATMSLAELALEAMARRGAGHRMSMEVRDDLALVLRVTCTFEIERPRQSGDRSVISDGLLTLDSARANQPFSVSRE